MTRAEFAKLVDDVAEGSATARAKGGLALLTALDSLRSRLDSEHAGHLDALHRAKVAEAALESARRDEADAAVRAKAAEAEVERRKEYACLMTGHIAPQGKHRVAQLEAEVEAGAMSYAKRSVQLQEVALSRDEWQARALAAEHSLAECRAVLRDIEWGDHNSGAKTPYRCPVCAQPGLDKDGEQVTEHRDGCRLARALSADPGRGRG